MMNEVTSERYCCIYIYHITLQPWLHPTVKCNDRDKNQQMCATHSLVADDAHS